MYLQKIAFVFIIGTLICCTNQTDNSSANQSNNQSANQVNDTNWLQWGGPSGDFKVNTTGLADKWPENGPEMLWERTLGEGYSTILYKDEKLYTMYSNGDEEIVISLDSKTGKTLWKYSYPREFWPDMRMQFGDGPNASPLIFDKRIISVGIAGDVHCLDLISGKLLWKLNLTSNYGRMERMEEYGYSNSPIRYKDFVIFHVGGEKHSLVALNPEDGSVVWEGGSGSVSYAQPSLIQLAGQDQFIYFSTKGVNGVDPANGELLWHHTIPISNGNNLTPIVQCDENHIYVSSQFTNGGGRLLKINKHNEKMNVEELWFDSRLSSSCWTLIRIGDYIYGSAGAHTSSKFTALEWKTGKKAWQHRQFTMAQCLYADDKAIFLDQKGFLTMAKVSPEKFDVLGSVKICEQVAWTLPTLMETKLYLRDRKSIMALELGSQ